VMVFVCAWRVEARRHRRLNSNNRCFFIQAVFMCSGHCWEDQYYLKAHAGSGISRCNSLK
jgi:hypothetical protein